jgi:hypothetical protein
VARNMRLERTCGMRQLADAQLIMAHQEHQAAQPGVIRQRGKEVGGGNLHGINIPNSEYMGKHIRITLSPPLSPGSGGCGNGLSLRQGSRASALQHGPATPEDTVSGG